MQKFIVSRDDTIYEAWPDLAMGADGRLLLVQDSGNLPCGISLQIEEVNGLPVV